MYSIYVYTHRYIYMDIYMIMYIWIYIYVYYICTYTIYMCVYVSLYHKCAFQYWQLVFCIAGFLFTSFYFMLHILKYYKKVSKSFTTLSKRSLLVCYRYCNKLSQIQGLKNSTNVLLYSCIGQKLDSGLTGPKPKYWQASFFSGDSRGDSFPLPLQLLEDTHIPWLMAPLIHLQTTSVVFF